MNPENDMSCFEVRLVYHARTPIIIMAHEIIIDNGLVVFYDKSNPSYTEIVAAIRINYVISVIRKEKPDEMGSDNE